MDTNEGGTKGRRRREKGVVEEGRKGRDGEMVKGEGREMVREGRGRGPALASLPFPLPKCFAHRIRETALGKTYAISGRVSSED